MSIDKTKICKSIFKTENPDLIRLELTKKWAEVINSRERNNDISVKK